MKIYLKPPVPVGEPVAVEIDSKIFFSSVKTALYHPEERKYTYTLNGLKGYIFNEQELNLVGPDRYFEIDN